MIAKEPALGSEHPRPVPVRRASKDSDDILEFTSVDFDESSAATHPAMASMQAAKKGTMKIFKRAGVVVSSFIKVKKEKDRAVRSRGINALKKPTDERDTEDVAAIIAVLKASSAKVLEDLDAERQMMLAQKITFESYGSGDVLWNEGDIGDCFYIILYGKAEVIKYDPVNKRNNTVFILRAGMGFGEIALQSTDCRRAAGVQCTSPCQLVRVKKDDYNGVLKDCDSEKITKRIEFLRGVHLFWGLPPASLTAMAMVLKETTVQHNSIICKEGDPAEELCFLSHGEVRIVTTVSTDMQLAELDEVVLPPIDSRKPRASEGEHRYSSMEGRSRSSRTHRRLSMADAETGPGSLRHSSMDAPGRSSRPLRRASMADADFLPGPKRDMLHGRRAPGGAMGLKRAAREEIDEAAGQASEAQEAADDLGLFDELVMQQAKGGGNLERIISGKQMPPGPPPSGPALPPHRARRGSHGTGPSRRLRRATEGDSHLDPHGESHEPHEPHDLDGYHHHHHHHHHLSPPLPPHRTQRVSHSEVSTSSKVSSSTTATARSRKQKHFVEVGVLPAGSIFGEVGLLGGAGRHEGTVISIGGCCVYKLAKIDMYRRLPPQVYQSLVQRTQHLRGANSSLSEQLEESVKWDRYKMGLLKEVQRGVAL